MKPERSELERSLTLFDGTMIVIGTIIGIGIFFTPSRVAGAVGSPGLALAAWALGGVIALTGAFTYAALGAALPRTGGPYVYLDAGLGRLPAFLYGYILLTAVLSGALAVIALVFADYLARFVPLGQGARLGVAALVLAVLALVNVLGVRWGSRVQNVVTGLKVIALLGLVAAAFLRGDAPAPDVTAGAPPAAPLGPVAGFVSAMVGVSFSFGGWQNLTNVAGEMKRPRRDLPRAILLGVLGVATLYFLANVAYLRLLPFAELVGTQALAAAALERAIGPAAGDVAAIVILASAFGILNGLMLAGPRIYYAMAQDGALFAAFGRVHRTFRTPHVAVLVQGGMAIVLLLLFRGSVNDLMEYVVFSDWLFFTLNALALFVLVRRGKARHVRLAAFGYPWLPAVFGTFAAAVTVGILVTEWQNARIGVLILALGVLLQRILARRPAPRPGRTS